MKDETSADSIKDNESDSTNNKEFNSTEEKSFLSKGIFNYKNSGTQGVISLFGYELTAPSGLKSPGIVYLSFIVVNLVVFLLVFKKFLSGIDL